MEDSRSRFGTPSRHPTDIALRSVDDAASKPRSLNRVRAGTDTLSGTSSATASPAIADQGDDTPSETVTETPSKPLPRYRLPGITREGIAQLSILETALWPLKGGPIETNTFDTEYTFGSWIESRNARVSVYAPHGLQSIDEYVLWSLLALSLSRKPTEPTLLATPLWFIQQLGLSVGGFQYDQLRASLERLASTAYQNTAFYNPVTKQHERVTFHFLSAFLPTKGSGGPVDADRAWRVEWSPMFFQMCQATGGTLLFDLDLYRKLTPAARRLFLKLKDRFWRAKKVFYNVDDLTIQGLGFSADRPLKKRKYDLGQCLRELLDHRIIELGRGQTDVNDAFIRRGKGLYVVQLFEGAYFRQPQPERVRTQKQVIANDPLFEPLRTVGVDEPGIRRLLKGFSRKALQQWLRITDAALHEQPRGFPGFKTSPAAFLIDGVQNKRSPPDWFHAHDKERDRKVWEQNRQDSTDDESSLRLRYEAERKAAVSGLLDSTEGRARFVTYRATFEVLFRKTDPDRFQESAHDAAVSKVERELLHFPDFGVWMLERRECGLGKGD